MRHGRRFASCAVGLGLVLSATLWINSGKTIRAQAGDLSKPEEPKPAVPAPVAGEPAITPPTAPLVLPAAARESPPSVPSPAPAAPDDPEKAAESFVDQTKQQADAQIKALTVEAEQLRARLKKVESAIGRWQTLRSALEQKPADAQAAVLPAPDSVRGKPALTPLEPDPPTIPGPEPRLTIPTDAEPDLALPPVDGLTGPARTKLNGSTPAPR